MEIPTEMRDRLGQDLLRSWQATHGFSTGSAKALSGPGQLAILLEQIFSPAESKLARDQHGEFLLRQYHTELVDPIASQMVEHLQNTLGKTVRSYSVNINLNNNQIWFIFTLG
jgi:hypothetical protein